MTIFKKDILKNEKLFLTGHTGTVKTSLIQQIESRINQPVVRVNVNGYFGNYTLKGGQTIWIDSVLPKNLLMNPSKIP